MTTQVCDKKNGGVKKWFCHYIRYSTFRLDEAKTIFLPIPFFWGKT